MHYLGKWAKVYAITPQRDTINLIHVPDWDFHWQGSYYYPKLVKIPAFSQIVGYIHYDNTANNPNNPFSPPQRITAGESTTQEMLLVYFTYTTYQDGDEFIAQGENERPTSTWTELPSLHRWAVGSTPSPNPTLLLDLVQDARVTAELFDQQGRLVHRLLQNESHLGGHHKIELGGALPAAGLYHLRLTLDGMPAGSAYVYRTH
jgi:hypothetical protein